MRRLGLAVSAFCLSSLIASPALADCKPGQRPHRAASSTSMHCTNPPPAPTSARGPTWRPRPEDYPSRADYLEALEGFRAAAAADRQAGRISAGAYQQMINNYSASKNVANSTVRFGTR